MNLTEIPEVFKKLDTVYHYTNIHTAIEYILWEKRLRLPPRRNSRDPIENIKAWFTEGHVGYDDNNISTAEIHELAKEKINRAKQLSFCMNDNTEYMQYKFPQHSPEFFGFLKNRMWDRYADGYKGVCLAFSLEELKKSANCSFVTNKVEYRKYNELKENYHRIDKNEIKKIGIANYWKTFSERIDQLLLRKHVDYEGENEYRFLSFSESEYDYINIESSLRFIIISENYTNDYMKHVLEECASKWGVEILFINWNTNGAIFQTLSERNSLIKKTSKNLEKIRNQNP